MAEQPKSKRVRPPVVRSRRDLAPAVLLCGRGRPNTYRPEYADLAERCMLLMMTEEEMAIFFGVSPTVLGKWKAERADFAAACAKGGDHADAEVVAALKHRAIGYSHPAVKFFLGPGGQVIESHYTQHYPPDTNAANLWLSNRRRGRWKMKPDPEDGEGDSKTINVIIKGGLPQDE